VKGFTDGDGVEKTEWVSQVVMGREDGAGFVGGDGVEKTKRVSHEVMESRRGSPYRNRF